jgi:hypothetical protein
MYIDILNVSIKFKYPEGNQAWFYLVLLDSSIVMWLCLCAIRLTDFLLGYYAYC